MYWLGLNCESQLIVKCQFAIVRMQKCIASSAHDWFRLHLLSLSTAIHEPSLVLEDHAQAGEITKATLLGLLDIYMYVPVPVGDCIIVQRPLCGQENKLGNQQQLFPLSLMATAGVRNGSLCLL